MPDAPITAAELQAAIGPVRGKVDLLTQRLGTLETAHSAHLDDADIDRSELRALRDWMIRWEARSEAQTHTLHRIFGTSAISAVSAILAIIVAVTTLAKLG